jgi:hypothetical protein
MNATRSTAKASSSYRQAVEMRVGRGIAHAFDEPPINNGWLIFCCHDLADAPGPYGCTPALASSANPDLEHGGGVAMRRRLNAFFAISVNSPPMSMVNYCCGVCSALNASARGVTRRVTPQPMRAAVRMEAGAHA